jgi:hypothetical protein
MMMAHDAGSMPPNAIAEQTVELVRAALERYVASPPDALAAGPAAGASSELRAALQTLAREARQKQVAPEQLLLVLKGIWFGLRKVQSAKEPAEQTQILQRVVTMCIKEYFSD